MEEGRVLRLQPYAYSVGRTIFQKICYVITEVGVCTGCQFGKGRYGPLADEGKLLVRTKNSAGAPNPARPSTSLRAG